MRLLPVALLVVLSWSLSMGCRPPAPTPDAQIVRQVDHLIVVSSDAQEMFNLLSDTLRLPVAWPMENHGGFVSGGVGLGNVNLEVIAASTTQMGAMKSRWSGFALEPEPLRAALSALDARGIRHGAPAPFRPNGFTTRWTTVSLPEISSDACEIFLCRFEDDVAARRRQLAETLNTRGGGPLSVVSVREMVLGAKDVEERRKRWQKLLDPERASAEGVWRCGGGPAIRLVAADHDGLVGLVVEVRSLPQAERWLKEQGWLESSSPRVLKVNAPLLKGLNLTLVATSSGGSGQ